MKKVNEANMNISVNGESASEVSELLRIMQLAGADAKEVGVDDINQDDGACPICGKMHSPGQSMGGCGSSSPKEPSMADTIKMISKEEEEFGMKDAVTDMQERLHDFAQEIQRGMHSYDNVVDELNDMFDEVKDMGDPIVTNAFKVLRSLEPEDFGEGEGGGPNRASMVAQDAMDMIDGSDDSDYDHLPNLEGYANEPDDEYMRSNAGDVSDMIPNGDDLHKEKGSYPATAGGDNPMNTRESIHAMLTKALAEKKSDKKPDNDGDGVPPWADKDDNDPEVGADDKEVTEYDVPSNFENKHKDINNLGRKMMDMSSNMSGTDDTSLMMANALSRLGEVLAEFGGSGFAANNMGDVVKKSSLTPEIIKMLMKKAKAEK